MTDYEQRLKVIRLHADKDRGSGYWIDFFAQSGISIEDAAENPLMMPPMDVGKLRTNLVKYFIPKSVQERGEFLVSGETSGFSGKPITSVFTESEFRNAFVLPFIEKAKQVGFPLEGEWLWAGPSGPHIIGKAVRAILHELNGIDPFSIDFDPRWFRRLPPGSISSKRYMEHIIEQMMEILSTQNIEIIFTTPPVLKALAEKMSDEERSAIRGVHYGGIAVSYDEYCRFKETFPNAVHLNGYGNSLFGVFLEESFTENGIEYNTESERVDVDVVSEEPAGFRRLDVGEKGRILMSRYDESFLLINMLERDVAVRTECGILNPGPAESVAAGKIIY